MNTPHVGIRKTAKNAVEKVDNLAKSVEGIRDFVVEQVQTTSQFFSRLEGEVEGLAEVINALVAVVGAEKVHEQVNQDRKARITKETEADKAALEKAVADGKIVPASKVTENSILVGIETDKDGNVQFPGRVQTFFREIPNVREGLKKEFQPLLLGAEVGKQVTRPSGGIFTLTEIYEAAPPVATSGYIETVEAQ